MLLSSLNLYVVAAFANGLGNRLRRIELASQLIEVGHLQIRAQLHGARVRGELAEQDAEQGALADPVIADDAKPITGHDSQREIRQQRFVPITMGDASHFDDLAAGNGAGFADEDACRLWPCDARGTNGSELLQRAYAPLVARLPGFDTLANPDFLLGQLRYRRTAASSHSIVLMSR